MKKRYILFIIFCFILFGCSTSGDEQAIKSSVSGYLDALQNADFEKAASYCDDSYNDTMGILNFNSSLDSQLKEINLGEDFNSQAKEFLSTAMKNTIQSYEIKDYKQDRDSATVIVDITGIDLSKVDMQNASQKASQEYSEYMNDHISELTEILNAKGEDAMKEEITKELSTMLFTHLNSAIENARPDTKTVNFNLKRIDNNWKLTSNSEQ